MEELRAAEAAEERSRPPDPEEVEAVAAEALEQAMQRRALELIGHIAPQFIPETRLPGAPRGQGLQERYQRTWVLC